MTDLHPQQFGGYDLKGLRNAPISGFNVKPDSAYRLVGEDGYQDFLNHGSVRANPNNKHGYEFPYFGDKPLARYQRRNQEFSYAFEAPRSNMQTTDSGFLRPTEPLGLHNTVVHRIHNPTGEITEVHRPEGF